MEHSMIMATPTHTTVNISISSVFSNSLFKNVIHYGASPYIDKKITKIGQYVGVQRGNKRKHALSTFYDYLLSDYRCEYIYKNFITRKLLLGRHSLNTSTLINEFRVSNSLADIVLVNGHSTVYEIKTELDSPDRLDSQLRDYQRAFSNICLVVHHSQANKYADLLSNTPFGVLALTSRKQLSTIKTVETDVSRLNVTTMFKCLRKQEYSNIIKKAFGYEPAVPNMFFFRECLKMAQKIPPVEFKFLFDYELRKRKPKHKVGFMSSQIPECLCNICLSIDPSFQQYERLQSFLNQRIG